MDCCEAFGPEGYPGQNKYRKWLRDLEAAPCLMTLNKDDPLDAYLLDTSHMPCWDFITPPSPPIVDQGEDKHDGSGVIEEENQDGSGASSFTPMTSVKQVEGPSGQLLVLNPSDVEDKIRYGFCATTPVSTEWLYDTLEAIVTTHGNKYSCAYAGATCDPTWRALRAPYAHLAPGKPFVNMFILCVGSSDYIRFWERRAIRVLQDGFRLDVSVLNQAKGGEGIPKGLEGVPYYLYLMI